MSLKCLKTLIHVFLGRICCTLMRRIFNPGHNVEMTVIKHFYLVCWVFDKFLRFLIKAYKLFGISFDLRFYRLVKFTSFTYAGNEIFMDFKKCVIKWGELITQPPLLSSRKRGIWGLYGYIFQFDRVFFYFFQFIQFLNILL